DDAIQEARKSMEIQKDYDAAYIVLGKTYMKMGRKDEALEMYKKLADLYPWWNYCLGIAYVELGNRDEAQKILNGIEKDPLDPWNAFCRAEMNAALGNKDEAFKWINYEPHHAFTAWVTTFPEFDFLHSDPRWDQFLKRLNLPGK
ncbi:MAG TPA: hypothetical protein DEO60_01925, partial [Bacteroidales bacterium]|nr:hypothetical protein [Bacteroidales bacterium]